MLRNATRNRKNGYGCNSRRHPRLKGSAGHKPKTNYETNPIGPLFSIKIQNRSQIPGSGTQPINCEPQATPPIRQPEKLWQNGYTPHQLPENFAKTYN
jgi:hypothetical protein